MKKIIIVISMLAVMSLILLGCARQLVMSPEQSKISSVSDTANCKFIQAMTFQTMPRNLIYWITLNTYNAGGDSYKIINTSKESQYGEERLIVNFEVYKCKSDSK